jgi:hypothetical protein
VEKDVVFRSEATYAVEGYECCLPRTPKGTGGLCTTECYSATLRLDLEKAVEELVRQLAWRPGR